MRRQTMLLRALLVALTLLLLGALVVIGLIANESRLDLPQYAALAWPTYIGIVLGFVPVGLALLRMYALAGYVERDEAFSADTVRAIHRIKRYIVWFIGWFFAGMIAFRVAFGFAGPAIGAIWLFLEVAALFLFAVVAILERLFAAAVALREDVDSTV